MKYSFLLLVVVVSIAACKPKELPALKHDEGPAKVSSVAMGENYAQQIFYSLKEDKIVAQNPKSVWDLKFESSKAGYHIFLNTSKFMSAYNTGKTDFTAVIDTSGFATGQKYDASNGDLEATAIGDWRQNKPVYIIDLGLNDLGNIGFVKLKITAVDENHYKLKFQSLPKGSLHEMTIKKDSLYNFVFLSFKDAGQQVNVAPPRKEWDLCFTQMTVEILIPYLVTGVLLNPYKTRALMDSTMAFNKIDLQYAQQINLSEGRDAIGFNWKDYNFDAASYTVFPQMIYIIKIHDGSYYKLHFLDFYDDNGVKGNPKFGFARL